DCALRGGRTQVGRTTTRRNPEDLQRLSARNADHTCRRRQRRPAGVPAVLGLDIVPVATVVVFVGDEVALWVVVVVDARLARVQPGWWDPLGAAVFAFAGGPAPAFDA